MFIPGSIKSSKWGWDVKNYTPKYSVDYTFNSTSGYWSPLTLAPNGLYYALPKTWYKTGTEIANEILCIKPGKSNNRTGKWEPAQIFLIPGTGGKRPPLPSYWASTSAGTQFRFMSQGVLSPGVISGTNNGFLYFFGYSEKSYVRLRPQLDPDADPMTATEWDVINYNDTVPKIDDVGDGSTLGSFYSGGVLGRDGYIYLIPCPQTPNTNFSVNLNRQKTVRIKPRNTSINTGNNDIIELGYYDATSSTKLFNKSTPPVPYAYGVDSTGSGLTIPSDLTASAYGNPTNSSKLNGNSLSNAIVHPNGKIYLFGGASKRIYIIEPSKWGTSSEVYTSNTIYIPNDLSLSPARGWFGQGFTATLEKLKPGQDPETLKIYMGYGGPSFSSSTNSTNRVYTRTIIFDPVTDTFTSQDYDNVTGEGVYNATTGSGETGVTSSFVNFPNGHIFQACKTDLTSSNPFGKLIYFDGDDTKYIGPQKRHIVSSNEHSLMQQYFSGAGGSGFSNAIPAIKSSFGKTFLSGFNGACEITSVKGFYPNIKHFSYTDDDSDIYDIPSDLSTLPTSLWNAYFNKPR